MILSNILKYVILFLFYSSKRLCILIFFIYFHDRYCPIIFLAYNFIFRIWYERNTSHKLEMGSVPAFSSIWKYLNLAPFPPYWLEEVISEIIWAQMGSLRQFLTIDFISLGNIPLYRFSNYCFLFCKFCL